MVRGRVPLQKTVSLGGLPWLQRSSRERPGDGGGGGGGGRGQGHGLGRVMDFQRTW